MMNLRIKLGRKSEPGTVATGFLLAIVTATICSCKPNPRIMNSASTPVPATQTAAETTPSTATFEQDIEAMRTADFNFIYVFRRKDGGLVDADDKRFAGAVTPPEINRRKMGDNGRAIIMGSNFRLPPDVMKQLTDRFAFEDFSRSETNSNVNK